MFGPARFWVHSSGEITPSVSWIILRIWLILYSLGPPFCPTVHVKWTFASTWSTIPCFELFMTAWEVLQDANPCMKLSIDIGLQWVTKYYKRMDNTWAYVIAMCEWHHHLQPMIHTNILYQSLIWPFACHGFKTIGIKNMLNLWRRWSLNW